jgi:hypothetical protein
MTATSPWQLTIGRLTMHWAARLGDRDQRRSAPMPRATARSIKLHSF